MRKSLALRSRHLLREFLRSTKKRLRINLKHCVNVWKYIARIQNVHRVMIESIR